ncbi:glycerophosphoryl diester phosphodiesterase [Corynebacterium timonense]|uniref:Glycerophosphoryl diester phosphodiesterase n=1 Tax=Corynebacterium timonense TaxID=441500 RepID=A0A1H1PD84_9CORY|nr:glycerophosphoryl diester phosphodiesterase [Corynebacterium timonense]
MDQTDSRGSDRASTIQLPLGNSPKPWIVAHRGQWRKAPENSIAAFRAAIEDGADILEADIRKTRDGHLVVIHDESVDRTTNGFGNVADLTLAELKQLRLREGLGNGPAPLTGHQIPTLEELLDAVEGHNVLINFDKGWDYREQIYAALAERDMASYGLFKNAPTVAEAVEFMETYPDVYYMHILNNSKAGHIDDFGDTIPHMFEINWDKPKDGEEREIQGTDEFWQKADGQAGIFANAMWTKISGGYTDEASILNPDDGWAYHVSRGADAIQTDDVQAMKYWRDGNDMATYLRGPDTIRVQAEDYVDDSEWYNDTTENECEEPIARPENPVDACNLHGARVIQFIRDGEYWALDVEVPAAGTYNLSMRQSSEREPGARVVVETENHQKRAVDLPNTTHKRNFTVEDLGEFELEEGKNRIMFTFEVPHDDYLSVDWVQADPVPTAQGSTVLSSGSSVGGAVAITIGLIAAVVSLLGAAKYFNLIPGFEQFLP